MTVGREKARNVAAYNSLDHGISPNSNGYAYAENLYWNPPSGSAAVTGWTQSAGHNANLLRQAGAIGIGISPNAAGQPYYAQLFK